MCKLFVIMNTDKINKLDKLIKTIADDLQATQRDGFGFVQATNKGFYGEKTIAKEYKSRIKSGRIPLDFPYFKKSYASFGVLGSPKGALICHGRTSTNDINLTNTHPILRQNWALSHNGVVSNTGEKYTKLTTNDSEDILYQLATSGIEAVEKHISGYYAFAALDTKNNLHLCKDDRASLYCAKLLEYKTYCFATSEESIRSVCHKMKIKTSHIEELEDNKYFIFSQEGNTVFHKTIKPLGYTYSQGQFANKSLGYNLYNEDYYSRNSWEDSPNKWTERASTTTPSVQEEIKTTMTTQAQLSTPKKEEKKAYPQHTNWQETNDYDYVGYKFLLDGKKISADKLYELDDYAMDRLKIYDQSGKAVPTQEFLRYF